MTRPIHTSTSPRTISELLSDESNSNFCRESGTFTAAADTVLVIGTALAVVSNAPVLFNPAASDGSEILAGFSLTSVKLKTGETEDIKWISNGPVRVVENRIDWPDGITAGQITSAKAVMEAKNVKFITGQGTTN